MISNTPYLKYFPKSLRIALLLLLAGWGCHLLFVYAFFSLAKDTVPSKLVYQQLIIFAVLGFFLLQAKKWARPLCLLCNALILILYTGFAALFSASRPGLTLLAVAVVGLFAAASYLLLRPEAKAFFDGAGTNKGAGGT